MHIINILNCFVFIFEIELGPLLPSLNKFWNSRPTYITVYEQNFLYFTTKQQVNMNSLKSHAQARSSPSSLKKT